MMEQEIRELLEEISYRQVGYEKNHYYIEGAFSRVYVVIMNIQSMLIIREYVGSIKKHIIELPLMCFRRSELKELLIGYRDEALKAEL